MINPVNLGIVLALAFSPALLQGVFAFNRNILHTTAAAAIVAFSVMVTRYLFPGAGAWEVCIYIVGHLAGQATGMATCRYLSRRSKAKRATGAHPAPRKNRPRALA